LLTIRIRCGLARRTSSAVNRAFWAVDSACSSIRTDWFDTPSERAMSHIRAPRRRRRGAAAGEHQHGLRVLLLERDRFLHAATMSTVGVESSRGSLPSTISIAAGAGEARAAGSRQPGLSPRPPARGRRRPRGVHGGTQQPAAVGLGFIEHPVTEGILRPCFATTSCLVETVVAN